VKFSAERDSYGCASDAEYFSSEVRFRTDPLDINGKRIQYWKSQELLPPAVTWKVHNTRVCDVAEMRRMEVVVFCRSK
jgi:hypothetical protein